jgi:hypothetical protein
MQYRDGDGTTQVERGLSVSKTEAVHHKDKGYWEQRFRNEEDAFNVARENKGVSIREDWQAPGFQSENRFLPWVVRWGPSITPTPVAPIEVQGAAGIAFLTNQLAEVMAKLNALEAKSAVAQPKLKGGSE